MISDTRQPDSPRRLVRHSPERNVPRDEGGSAPRSALSLRGSEPAEPDRRLSRRQRLTGRLQFERTYAQRQRFVGRFMVLWCYTGKDAALRLGVVASRRIGTAVMRSRAKRRLRELFRLSRPAFEGRSDVVLVARPAVIDAPWRDLVEELNRLAARAGLCGAGASTGAGELET